MPLNEENAVSKPEPEPERQAQGRRGRGGRGRGRGRGGRGGGGGKGETRKSGRSSTRAKARAVDEDEEEEGEETKKSRQPTLKDFFGAKPASKAPNAKPSSSKNEDTAKSSDVNVNAEDEEGPADKDAGGGPDPASQFVLPHQVTSFPVVITTYEMIIKDRIHLSKYKWEARMDWCAGSK